jgi:hypothetical protein
MSALRVLVGTKKGAFILTADGARRQWEVTGPHFPGWEIYHLKGSPADPNRIFASQTSGWFGQVIQRSNDGGKTWEPVGTSSPTKATPARTSGTTGRRTPGSSNASGTSSRRCPTRRRFTPERRTQRSSAPRTAARPGKSSLACASKARAPRGSRARGAWACTPSSSTRATSAACTSPSRPRESSERTTEAPPGGPSTSGSSRSTSPTPRRKSVTACTASRCIAPGLTSSSCRNTGT